MVGDTAENVPYIFAVFFHICVQLSGLFRRPGSAIDPADFRQVKGRQRIFCDVGHHIYRTFQAVQAGVHRFLRVLAQQVHLFYRALVIFIHHGKITNPDKRQQAGKDRRYGNCCNFDTNGMHFTSSPPVQL